MTIRKLAYQGIKHIAAGTLMTREQSLALSRYFECPYHYRATLEFYRKRHQILTYIKVSITGIVLGACIGFPAVLVVYFK